MTTAANVARYCAARSSFNAGERIISSCCLSSVLNSWSYEIAASATGSSNNTKRITAYTLFIVSPPLIFPQLPVPAKVALHSRFVSPCRCVNLQIQNCQENSAIEHTLSALRNGHDVGEYSLDLSL